MIWPNLTPKSAILSPAFGYTPLGFFIFSTSHHLSNRPSTFQMTFLWKRKLFQEMANRSSNQSLWTKKTKTETVLFILRQKAGYLPLSKLWLNQKQNWTQQTIWVTNLQGFGNLWKSLFWNQRKGNQKNFFSEDFVFENSYRIK